MSKSIELLKKIDIVSKLADTVRDISGYIKGIRKILAYKPTV